MEERKHYVSADAAERQRQREHDDLRRRVEIIELKMELAGLRGARLGWARTGPEQDQLREEYEEKIVLAREIRERLAELESER